MILKEKKIAIIGFGNQGEAWALNLRDSGYNIKVALKAGSKSLRKAADHNLDVLNMKQAFLYSDVICVLAPDETHPEIIEQYSPSLDDGQSLVFAHGYNIHYNLFNIQKNVDTILVAPKGTGESLRKNYLKDSGLPCLIAVHRDSTGNAWQTAKALAEGLGCHKVGIYKSTFKEETEINLFTENAFYLSVLPQAIIDTYRTLVDEGYSKEASYYEAVHKIKIFGDLLSKHGIVGSFENVSSLAKIGGILSKDRLITDSYRRELKKILKEIQDGTFIKKVEEEISSGFKTAKDFLEDLKGDSLEAIGKKLRDREKRYE